MNSLAEVRHILHQIATYATDPANKDVPPPDAIDAMTALARRGWAMANELATKPSANAARGTLPLYMVNVDRQTGEWTSTPARFGNIDAPYWHSLMRSPANDEYHCDIAEIDGATAALHCWYV